jgi:hypothetical protein
MLLINSCVIMQGLRVYSGTIGLGFLGVYFGCYTRILHFSRCEKRVTHY